MTRQPVLLISHGSPMRALEGGAWGEALRNQGVSLSPNGILMVSAHWEAEGPARITAAPEPGLLYDFYGFPEALYGVRYPVQGSPKWAQRVEAHLAGAGIASVLDVHRPLDHGAWAPLLHLFPRADQAVLQLSLPLDRTPARLYAMGQALAPLREQGLLIIGSGGIVHNLRRLRWREPDAAEPDPWAAHFDAWAAERLRAGDTDALLRWREESPDPHAAHPSTEHWDPLFVALGAAGAGTPRWIYEGWEMGNLNMRSAIWD
ncbi:MAG: dioxygenase [Acidobacteria bacterium]|nr:dioxygenase [Acidobacteriota bacterium]